MKRNLTLKLKLFILFSLLISHFSFLSALSLDETLRSLSSISGSANRQAQFRWDPLMRSGTFNMGGHFGSFFEGDEAGETGFLVFNNQLLFHVPLPYSNNGNLVFPQPFVDTLKTAFSRSLEDDASRFRVSAIVIDPGHGGRDPGAIGRHNINGRTVEIREKDIALQSGLLLRDMLNRTFPDRQVVMTRETDVFLSLERRTEIANAVPAADNEVVIFVSIHANWGANPNARGYEVWHITSGHRRPLSTPSMQNYSPEIRAILSSMLEAEIATESVLLADSILQGFEREFGNSLPSRGRRAHDWFVVRNSHMPAVLVELGFVSNREDAILMTSDEGLRRLTLSMYNGIKNFIGIIER